MSESAVKGWRDRVVDLLLIATLVGGGVTAYRMIRPANATPPLAVRTVADWKSISDSGRHIGAAATPIVITEFTDYQCPVCAMYSGVLAGLVAEHPQQVSLSIRHFPLTLIHPAALDAAIAAECAGNAGRFEAYHDALFEGQSELNDRRWAELARAARITNVDAFNDCVAGKGSKARVQRDLAAGRRLGVRGTPAIMVNDQYFPDGISPDSLAGRIKAMVSSR